MITPKEFGLAVAGLEKAIGLFFELRGSGHVRLLDSRTAAVHFEGANHIVQLDDAFGLTLRRQFGAAELKSALDRTRVDKWSTATHTQYQAKRIGALISRRRLLDAQPAERRLLVEILVYARATRAFGNRFNGLAAAIEELRSLERLPAFRGTLSSEMDQWEKCLRSMRRRARLLRQLRRLERELEATA